MAEIIKFRELKAGDTFHFADPAQRQTEWEYRGNGFYNVPYSGGPWLIPLTSYNAEVAVVRVRAASPFVTMSDRDLARYIEGCHMSREYGADFEAACRERNSRDMPQAHGLTEQDREHLRRIGGCDVRFLSESQLA